jgi:alpha-galactosidase
MQRRQFLQLSGFSAAALFFSTLNAESGIYDTILQFPSKIAVLRDGKWLPLTGSKDLWTLDRLTVDLKHMGRSGSSMGIELRAPGIALEKIRLSWDRAFSGTAKCLGDAWERSYGDLAWNSEGAMGRAPWYLLVNDGDQTHAFGVKTGAKCFCYWQTGSGQLNLVLDTYSGGAGVELGDRVLHAAEIVTTQSRAGENPFQTDTRFCKMMCEKPRLPKKPVYGINDWYFAYGNSSKDMILSSTRSMAELATDTGNRPFSVVDDGWELGADFSRSNAKFGDMSAVATEIKKIGMRPGLWTRPLLANNDKESLLRPLSKGQNGSRERYLDPTLSENLERIRDTIKLYREWGYELVKHDYSSYDIFGRWGGQMKEEMTVPGWHFNDQSRTNAEIISELYRAIREAAGNMYLIGCNTVSHLSAGVFELNRIGDDTSGREWERTIKYGVNTMGFRLPQHNTFYAVDGDCVGLTTKIPWKNNRQWMQLLAESGAPLFISAQPEATGPEQKEYIKKCFDQAARVQPTGEPLDWMTSPRPSKWKLNGRVVEFEW